MPKKNAQQKELPGMPKRDELGEKAVEYLNLKEELAKEKDELEIVKAQLANLFQAANMTNIRVDGVRITCSAKKGYKITVKQEKEL